MESAPTTVAVQSKPGAGAGAAAAARAVLLVDLTASALAMFLMGGWVLAAGEFAAIVIVPIWIGLAAFGVLLFALPVAAVLGAILARCNAVAAALLVAPIAGFLVPLGLFRDVAFAGGCGAVSILVGLIFATDSRFSATA